MKWLEWLFDPKTYRLRKEMRRIDDAVRLVRQARMELERAREREANMHANNRALAQALGDTRRELEDVQERFDGAMTDIAAVVFGNPSYDYPGQVVREACNEIITLRKERGHEALATLDLQRRAQIEKLRPLADCARALFRWMRAESFFGWEESEELLPIMQAHGFVERKAYDPEKHGDMEAEPGDIVWIWTDAFKRATVEDRKTEEG